MVRDALARGARIVASWRPEERDAVLYSASALFAVITAQVSSIGLYQQWGRLATGPYAVGAVLSAVLARRAAKREHAEAVVRAARAAISAPTGEGEPQRAAPVTIVAPAADGSTWHWTTARMLIFLIVLLGATFVPLSLEVLWQSSSTGTAHVQPEALVIEHSGSRLYHRQDPYQLVGKHPKAPPGQPAYDAYNPYLPLMSVFGLAHSTNAPPRLTDARVGFSLITILLVIAALALCRGPTGPRVLALQSMTVLPTAALPLATGGDDLPVAALLLLALVLLQRRRPLGAGIALGVAASMKITAWPLAALAFLVAYDRNGTNRRRAGMWVLVGLAGVMIPAILPTAAENFSAFIENVVRFPLGLAGVASPAASPLLGHLVVTSFPGIHRAFTVSIAAGGGLALAYVLVRHTPRTAGDLSLVVAWVMTVAILLAPATRIGYLLYPVNFFVWSWLLKSEDAVAPAALVTEADLSALDASARRADSARDRERVPIGRGAHGPAADVSEHVGLQPVLSGTGARPSGVAGLDEES